MLARFRHHYVIATDQQHLIGSQQMRPNHPPLQVPPIQGGIEKALDRAITPPLARPAGEAAHRHPPAHGQQGLGYPRQLTQLGRPETLAKTTENQHNVDQGRLLLG